MSSVIPVKMRPMFMKWMEDHDDDDAPDGAWFHMLELAGQEFIDNHKLKWCDGNDAAHKYLKWKGDPPSPEGVGLGLGESPAGAS